MVCRSGFGQKCKKGSNSSHPTNKDYRYSARLENPTADDIAGPRAGKRPFLMRKKKGRPCHVTDQEAVDSGGVGKEEHMPQACDRPGSLGIR